MQCPKDGTQLLTELYEEAIEVDVCPDCAGMWLDKGELEQLVELRRSQRGSEVLVPDSAALSYEMALQEADMPCGCPRCRASMDRREYGLASQVLVDVCPKGCGMWLDRGEYTALESFLRAQHADQPESMFMGILYALFPDSFR